MTSILAAVTSGFAAGAVLAGLAAIAGVLFLLQRLRVRHRPVLVISTLFWRAAVEEARARVLVERFRHPLVYLFLLAICALLWLAAAGLDGEDRDGRRHLVLIEGSAAAGMTEPQLAETLRSVATHVDELPRDRRSVILCADVPRTLLAAGEPARVLDERVDSDAALVPARAPSTLEATLADLLPSLDALAGTTVWIAGARSVAPSLAARLPENVTLAVLPPTGELAATVSGNRAIIACGVSAAASGAWDRVDLLVDVRGSGDLDTLSLSMTLDGLAPSSSAERAIVTEAGIARVRYRLRDIPARGQRFEAAIVAAEGAADANPLDDQVVRVLPVRTSLRVALSPSLAPWLAPVLSADPAVRLVDGGSADVAVRRAGEMVGGDVPALTFRPRASQEESILLSHDAEADSAAVLSRALLDLGLDQVDAMELAAATGTPITLGARPAARREIGVWDELLAEEYNFVSSRSFPLFVALSLRWILDVEDFPAEIAAGRPLAGVSAVRATAPDAPLLDPIGATLIAPSAGDYVTAEGEPISIAMLPAGAIAFAEADLAPLASVRSPGAGGSWTTFFALVAAALLALEWFLHRRGELP